MHPMDKPKPSVTELEKGDMDLEPNKAGTNDELMPRDEAMEARVRWKADIRIIPLCWLTFLAGFIDQSNIGNARLAGLERDLDMQGYDFNIAISVASAVVVATEIPLLAACKRAGPGRFLAATTFGLGLMCICGGLVQGFAALCGVRVLLGLFEAAILPGLMYYLSRWYRESELTFRISLFMMAAPLSGAFGGLLASAILKIPGMGWLHSWRLVFVIEGIPGCLLGIALLLFLPDSPLVARFLSPAEKQYAAQRIHTEQANGTELIDKFNWTKFYRGIFNPVVIISSVMALFNSISISTAATFLPTLVATIFPEEDVNIKQLLTVPPYVVGAIASVATSYVSWKVKRRGPFLIGSALFCVAGFAMFISTHDPKLRYAALFLPFLGMYTYGPLTGAHCAANVVTDTARSGSLGFHIMMANTGGLIAKWAFVESDAPYYPIGIGLNLAGQTAMVLLASGMYWWIVKDNKKREETDGTDAISGLTESQVQNLDWKHPDFRWKN